MSGQQQINHWREQSSNNSPTAVKRDVTRPIRNYQKGAITLRDFGAATLELLTEDNVQDFLAACPAEVLKELQEEVSKFPADDDDASWQEVRFFSVGTIAIGKYEGRDLEALQREQEQVQKRRRALIREAIKVFRQHVVYKNKQ